MSGIGDLGDVAPSLMRASLVRSGKWAGGVGAVGGFVADILQPLAPFAAYIALIASVAAFVIAIAIVFRLVLAVRAMPALVFATTTAAIAGGVFALQKASAEEDGLIAGLVPAVAQLQQSLGIVTAKVENIEKKVTETQQTVQDVKQDTTAVKQDTAEIKQDTQQVKQDTAEVKQTTEEVKKTTEEVKQTTEKVEQKTEEIAASQAAQKEQTEHLAQKTDQVAAQTEVLVAGQQKQQAQAEKLQSTTEEIAVSIDRIADGFEALATQGGLIADPKRPDEFYHNARIHELGGDMLNARRSYLGFANFDVDAVDPYIRFATLLRVQDGKAGAREVFGTLAEKGKALSLKLVHALQFDDAQRVQRLNDFIAANPDYAPAYFLLSEEFSLDRLGAQSLSDKRSEAEALTKFMSYEKDGGLLKYFVDHTLLSDWLDRSRSRLASLGNVLDANLFMPKLIPMRSNADWMVTVSLPEPATAISWRLGATGSFTETGFLAMNDQTTGKPMPNPSFALPADTTATTIGLKYIDIRGREAGPFDIKFDPMAALVEGNKQILDQFWTSWIAFDASGNTGNVYFTHILSYRCSIKGVKYSLNGAALDKAIDMPPCNEKDPYAIPDGYMPFFKVGPEVKSMSVQITYVDDTQSPVREFRR